MGGYGSGRWRTLDRREVVEHCVCISADDLPIISRPSDECWLPVRRHSGQIIGYLACRSIILEDGILALAFQLHAGNDNQAQVIPLGTTPARHGGVRRCFLCPIGVGESYCAKPSRKLFVPPTEGYLGCRRCYSLSYSSAQRRAERLARVDTLADDIADESDELLARIEREEPVEFDEMLKVQRRLNHVVYDLWESLRLQ